MGSVLVFGSIVRFGRHASKPPGVPYHLHQSVLGHGSIPRCWSYGLGF